MLTARPFTMQDILIQPLAFISTPKLVQMTKLFHQFELQIIALFVAFFGGAIRYLFRPRPRLIYSFLHSFPFVIQPDPAQPNVMGLAETASLWVKNGGREAATDVELTFNYRPQFYNLWPARHFEPVTGIANRHTLQFSSIAPREEFHIEMISSGQKLPEIDSFPSKEGIAKLTAMHFSE